MRGLKTSLVVALVALAAIGASRVTAAPPCTITWDGSGGTAWSTAASWDLNRTPIALDDVCIPELAAGVEVVHSSGTVTILSLQGSGDVQISGGVLEVTSAADPPTIDQLVLSSGTLTGAGTVRVATTATVAGGTQNGTGKTVIEPAATMTVSGGTTLSPGRTLEVGGTLAIAGDHSIFSGGLLHVLSGGVVRKSAGTSSSSINALLDNDGTVEITAASPATLTLPGGSGVDTSTGTFGKAGATGLVRFTSGTHTIGSASFAGGVDIAGGIVTIPTGQTISATDANSLTSGTLSGDGTYNVPSGAGLTVSGGTMSGVGKTAIGSGATMTLTGGTTVSPGRTLEVGGTLAIAGDHSIFSGGLLHVLSGGVVRKTAGTSSSSINPALDNDGTVEITAGAPATLTLPGGSGAETSTGTFGKAGSTGLVRFTSSTHTIGPATFAGGVDIAGAVVTIPTSATVTASDANSLTSGTLSGDGTYNVPSGGALTVTGGTMSGAGKTAIGAGGTMTLSGGTTVAPGRTLEVGGTLAIAGDHSIFSSGLVRVLSGGVIRKTAGTSSSSINPALDNDGTVEITAAAPATLTLPGGSGADTSTGTFGKAGSTGLVRLTSNAHTIGPATFAGGVDLAGSTVTIPAGQTITATGANQMTTGSVTGTGALSVTGTLSWSGGTMGGAGTTTIAAGATLNLTGGTALASDRTLEVAGLVDMQGDRTMFRSGVPEPRIHVAATGVVRKTSGTGIGIIDVALRNQGTVDSDAGRLELRRGPADPHTGAFTGTSQDALVVFDNGTHTLGSGTTLSGPVEVGGAIVDVPTGVTLQVPDTLVVSGGTLGGAGTVAVTGTLRWTGGTQSGPGTTSIAAAAQMTVDGNCFVDLDNGRQVLNNGTISVRGGRSIDGFHATRPVIENAGRLEFDVSSPAACGSSTGISGNALVHNTGTIERLGGPGTSVIDATLDNDATLLVTTGELALSSTSAVTHSGSFTAAAGATVAFDGGTFVLAPAATVAGSVAVSGARLEIPPTTTLTIGASDTFTQSGGTIAGGGTLRVLGTFAWTNGTQEEGATVLEPGASATVGGAFSFTSLEAARTLVNRATLVLAGGELYLDSGASLLNVGTLELQESSQLNGYGYFGFGYTGALLDNTGIVRKTGSGVDTSNVELPVDNDGTLEVLGGSMVVSGRLLNLSDDPAVGGDASLTGGTMAVHGGTLELRSPIEVNAAHIVLDGASSFITWRTSILAPAQDALASLRRNAGNGVLEVTGGRSLTTFAPLTNAGTVRVGAGSTLISTGAYKQTGGVTQLTADTARLTAEGAAVEVSGGRLAGRGSAGPTVQATGGAIEPGLAGAGALGADAFGAAVGATVRARIASATPPLLAVSGAATLGGKLAIETDPGFTPVAGMQIPIATYASRTGTFGSVTGLQPGGGVQYSLVYGATQLSLNVAAARPAAEPDVPPAPVVDPSDVAPADAAPAQDALEPVRIDDRALAVGRGSWARTRLEGRTYTVATARGATLLRRGVRGGTLSLLAYTCRRCGAVDVYWRGRRLGRVSLWSNRSGRRLLRVAALAGERTGTVRLRTVSSRRVAVDALVVAGR